MARQAKNAKRWPLSHRSRARQPGHQEVEPSSEKPDGEGNTITAFESSGIALADRYWILRLGDDPAGDLSLAMAFLGAGAFFGLLTAVCAYFGGRKRRRSVGG